MKWQCALLQRWLPEYPDGDLPAFFRWRLRSHLERCPACRVEQAALAEVVQAIQTAPVADPGADFWGEFSRELHLKLAQAAQASPGESPGTSRKWLRLPYLVGAPALAVLLLWVATYLTNPERPVLAPAPQVAQTAKPEKAMAAKAKREAPKAAEVAKTPAAPAAPPQAASPEEVYSYATMQSPGEAPDDDFDLSTWDLDSVLAGMTEQEKEVFLKKMHQHEKDGSCLAKSSAIG